MLSKDELRGRVWRLMEERAISRFPKPIEGRIPNFEGSGEAARRLIGLRAFRGAGVIKVNPDYAQFEVRKGVLEAGKTLLMPTPRLRKGFLVLDPSLIREEDYHRAVSIRGSFSHGVPTPVTHIPKVDFIVCGSVAVTGEGVRVGKGGGYSDLEYGILREMGKADEFTPIATTVHEAQVVDEAPLEMHDFTLNYIATPKRIITVSREQQRPEGIMWGILDEEKITSIPMLNEFRDLK